MEGNRGSQEKKLRFEEVLLTSPFLPYLFFRVNYAEEKICSSLVYCKMQLIKPRRGDQKSSYLHLSFHGKFQGREERGRPPEALIFNFKLVTPSLWGKIA